MASASLSGNPVAEPDSGRRSMRTTPGTWLLIGALTICIALMATFARGMASSNANPAVWTAFVAAAFAAGGFLVLIWRRGDISTSTVLALALVYRLAFVWMPPVLSDDAYRYVWDGMLQAEGVNPYVYTPDDEALSAHRDQPIYEQLNSEAYYSVYPPLSQLIFAVGGWFYDYGWHFSYYVIKAILALLEFGAVLVLTRLVGPAALALYAWNPLVLIAGAGQAHGEAALVFFVSLTILAARRGRGGRAGLWLACASWVKLYPLVLFPFLWRRFGWRSLAVGGLATTLIALPYAHPVALGNVFASLDLYVRLFEFNAGLYYLVKELFHFMTGADWSKQIGPAFRLAFVVLMPMLYMLDWRHRWTLERSFAVAVGAFFLLSTTVHPWYLLAILVVTAASPRTAWHWQWLGVVSLGTYLLYVDGPYWIWVILGWSGWLVLAVHRHGRAILDALMRYRARGKADLVDPFLARGDRLLDVGAAEGFVAERLVGRRGIDASLVDVVDMNRSDLPHRVYDGRNLPYDDDAFDIAIAVYVLHHAEDAEQVVREMVRVAGRRVIIVESTYVYEWERRLLRLIDHLLNAIRSLGRMERETLRFRTFEEWTTLFRELGIDIVARRDLGGFVHHRALYILNANQAE